MAGAEFDGNLVQAEATDVEAAGAPQLLLREPETSPGAVPVEVSGHGGSMDAVLPRECDDAFAGHVPLDQLVDLGGCQEGLSCPDFAHDDPIRSGPTDLPAVGDPAERPPPHAGLHGNDGPRRVREASQHVRSVVGMRPVDRWLVESMTTLTSLPLASEAQDLLFREARTANAFTDEPIGDDVIEAIYDLIKWAPSSMNTQLAAPLG